MSMSNLSAAANDTIRSFGKTAVSLIDAYRAGGSLVLNRVDTGWQGAVHGRATRLSEQLQQDLIAAQREISGYYARGLHALSGGAASAVHTVANAVSAGIDTLSNRVERFEEALGPTPLASAIVIAQPFVQVGREVAGFVAERATQAVSRIEGAAPEIKATPVKHAPVRRKGTRRS